MKLENKTIPQLEKVLWKEFSIYIRNRDKNICFTCGGQGNQAGHFIPRTIKELKYNEKNVHAQCTHCNMFLSGNSVVYEKRLREIYGNKIVDYFREVYFEHKPFRYDKENIIEKIIFYRNKNKE